LRAKSVFAILLLGLLISGCSPLRVISAVSPIGPGEDHRDIPFGTHELAVDVYLPDTDADAIRVASKPVIMFLLRWQLGARHQGTI